MTTDRTLAEEQQSDWKWTAALGVVMVVLGFVILGNVLSATLVTTIWIGIVLIGAGVVEAIGALGPGRRLISRVAHVLLAILYVVVGVEFVLDPLRGAITLTIVAAAMLVADGVVRLVEVVVSRPEHVAIAILVAIVDIVLGLWLWSGIPFSGIAIGFFVGFQVVLAGLSWIALGWAVRNSRSSPALV